MAKLQITAGATSQTVNIFIQDSSSTTGAGLAGLVYNTSGLTAYYALSKAASVSVTLATLAAVTSSYSSGGFKEIDATNMPGWYRFDIPNAAIASGIFTSIHFQGAANMAPLPLEIELIATNNQDAVRGGMTALPNAAAEASGGLYTRGTGAGQINQDANGRIDANVKTWIGGTIPAVNVTGVPLVDAKYLLGTIFSTPATAGIVDVNVKNIDNDAASASGTVTFPNATLASTTNITAATGIDVTKLGGVTQSLTDLKDFADTGYDPSTHKVAGVVLTDTLTTYTGNTPQTGDSYARLGAPAGASISADILQIKGYVDDIGVAGAGLTAIPWNAAWDAEVQSEVDDALIAKGLDHIVFTSVAGTDIADDSIIAKMVSKSATADWDSFTNTTDSLEALRDRGDAAWITATGFSTHSAADVWAVATRILTAGTNIVLAKGTGVTGFTDLSAAAVNAEVVDALATDTYAEPTGVPGATVSLAAKINRIYQALRNKMTTDATDKTFFDDSGAALWSKPLSDDATTYTEGEGEAP